MVKAFTRKGLKKQLFPSHLAVKFKIIVQLSTERTFSMTGISRPLLDVRNHSEYIKKMYTR